MHTKEPLAKLNKTVTPVTSEVQKTLKNLDSGLRRNDVEVLLQEALKNCALLSIGLRVFYSVLSPVPPLHSSCIPHAARSSLFTPHSSLEFPIALLCLI
jgi:hypothetical protein